METLRAGPRTGMEIGEQGVMGRAICGSGSGSAGCVGFGQVLQNQIMWCGCASHRRRSLLILPNCHAAIKIEEEKKGKVSWAANGKRERSRKSTPSREGVRQTHCTPGAPSSPWHFASQLSASRSGWAFDSASSAVQKAVTVRSTVSGSSGAPSSHPPMNIPMPPPVAQNWAPAAPLASQFCDQDWEMLGASMEAVCLDVAV